MKHGNYLPTSIHKNNETNDKFYRKVAFLMYTEKVNFRPESWKAVLKQKLHRRLGHYISILVIMIMVTLSLKSL